MNAGFLLFWWISKKWALFPEKHPERRRSRNENQRPYSVDEWKHPTRTITPLGGLKTCKGLRSVCPSFPLLHHPQQVQLAWWLQASQRLRVDRSGCSWKKSRLSDILTPLLVRNSLLFLRLSSHTCRASIPRFPVCSPNDNHLDLIRDFLPLINHISCNSSFILLYPACIIVNFV